MGIETALVLTTFATNTAVTLGLSLVGNWINPPRTKSQPEGIPTLGQGNLVYCWGNTYCNTQLLYAVPPVKAGHSDDRSSYGFLGFCNPDSTARLTALRMNDYIVSSEDNLFPINIPSSIISTSSRYVNYLGLSTVGGLNYGVQMQSTQVNSHFSMLGYSDLRYRNLTWVSIQAAERKVFGGASTRSVLYVKNAVVSSTPEAFDIRNGGSVTVEVTYERQGTFTSQWSGLVFTYPSGFYGARVLISFSSDQGDYYNAVGIGGNIEFVLESRRGEYNNVYFKVLSPVSPGTPTTTQGQFTNNVLPRSSIGVVEPATMVIHGREGQSLTSTVCNSAATTPLTVNTTTGVVTGQNGVTAATIPTGRVVFGWNNKMFTNSPNDPFYPIVGGNIIAGSQPMTGTRSSSLTSLQRIITDIFNERRGESIYLDVAFRGQPDPALGLNVAGIPNSPTLVTIPIRGFTSNLESAKDTLINLATAYALIIDEFTQPGTIIFREYPDDSIISKRYTLFDYIEEPLVETSPDISQPNQIELSYRSWEREFSEQTLTVGYGNSFPNKKGYRLDLVLTETEAKKVGWTLLFLTSHTNISVKLKVADISGLTIGSVIVARLRNDTNLDGQTVDRNVYADEDLIQSGKAIKLVVIGLDVGADRTYQLSCINYINIKRLLKVSTSASFNEYLLLAEPTAAPALPVEPRQFLVAAEPVTTNPINPANNFSPSRSYLYTDKSDVYNGFTANNIQTVTKSPSSGGFRGDLITTTSQHGNSNRDIASLTLRRRNDNFFTPQAGTQLIRVGSSWVRYTGWTQESNLFTLTGVSIGKFGSYPIVYDGDVVIQFSLADEVPGTQTTANNSPTGGTFSPGYAIQSGKRVDLFQTPPSDQYPSGIQFGQVTLQYPHGVALPGAVIACTMSSYTPTTSGNGILRLWVGLPGAVVSNGFFLDNPTPAATSISNPPFSRFWFKPLTGSAVLLSVSVLDRFEGSIAATVSLTGYSIYQRSTSGAVLPFGGNSWIVG